MRTAIRLGAFGLLCTALFLGAGFPGSQSGVAHAQAALPAPVFVDMGNLPADLELADGQEVILIDQLRVGASTEFKTVATDGKGELLKGTNRATTGGRQGYHVVAAYRATRSGSGYIRVSHTPVVPYPKTTTHEYIKIKVR